MRNRSIALLAIMCAVLPGALAAQTDVAGEWVMAFMTDQGTTEATMTLEQDGETLVGSSGCVSVQPGEVAVVYNHTGLKLFGPRERASTQTCRGGASQR